MRVSGIFGQTEILFSSIELPVGGAAAAATPSGLMLLDTCTNGRSAEKKLTKRIGAANLIPCNMDNLWRQLADYFKGSLHKFELDLDLILATPFQRSVLTELMKVPYGETVTYGELADRIGKPKATRAVGQALNKNPLPFVVPCHRVVGSDGSLTGYAGGLSRKRKLLELESRLIRGAKRNFDR